MATAISFQTNVDDNARVTPRKPGPQRVLMVGDGIGLTTGFAQVLRYAAKVFRNKGWEVAQVASLDHPPNCDSRPYYNLEVRPFFPDGLDIVGYNVFEQAVLQFDPDVVLLNCDPGAAYNWFKVVFVRWPNLPVVAYMPIEGAPVCPEYATPFKMAYRPITYTRWSHDRLMDEYKLDIPWVYHGVNRRDFKPLTPQERAQVRATLGWKDDQFIVSYVARNAGRKAQDRLIKAMRWLKDWGYGDQFRAYLHCKPFDSHNLQGWDLRGLVHWIGVPEMILFPKQEEAARGEKVTGLAQKLAASDLYCHVAKVEGFGLPIVEAMASGLPIVGVNDGGNQTEVIEGDYHPHDGVPRVAAAMIGPCDQDTWFNGAQLANVHPETLAKVILELSRRPDVLERAGKRSLQRALDFSWGKMGDVLLMAVQEAADARTALLTEELAKQNATDAAEADAAETEPIVEVPDLGGLAGDVIHRYADEMGDAPPAVVPA